MISQKHSGSGDNVAGNKNTKTYIAINSIWIAAIIFLVGLGAWLIPKLLPQPVPLSGYVLSNARVPEPGVAVSVKTSDQLTYETFTDENGFFLFEEVNLRKIDSVEISASLKERSAVALFEGLGPETARLNIQLPPGTPPFEVGYYEIQGVSLNYLYDGKVDQFWEKRLGGQPFIIPNEVYQTFKDLGNRFYFEHFSGDLPILDPANQMARSSISGKEYSRELRGISTDQPLNGNTMEYDVLEISTDVARQLIRKIDGWSRYSPASKRFESVSKDEMIEMQAQAEAAILKNEYNALHEAMKAMWEVKASLTATDLAIIAELTGYEDGGIIDYVSREQLPDGFIRAYFSEGCGGGEVLNLTKPTYHLKAAVLENNTNDPVALDSFYIAASEELGLRSEKENREEAEIVKRLFPKKTVKPGDKLLIPAAIIFTSSRETQDYKYIHEEFFYGPSWTIRQVRAENQIFPFREKDSELVALYYGGGVGSCPYAYTYSEEKGYWMLENHILFGRSSPEKVGFDEIPLKRFTGSLLIKEEDPETSFIDWVEIRLETEDGRSLFLSPDHQAMRVQDGINFRMEQGDEIKLTFEGFDAGMEARYYLRSYGYYEPYRPFSSATFSNR